MADIFDPINPDDFFNSIDPEEFFNRGFNEIKFGYSKDGGYWYDLDFLKTHMHVIGLTGTGKSFFLDLIMRQFLALKKGFCLIDPLGFLYQAMVNYIAHHPQYAERVIFFDATKPSEYLVGYNPLKPPHDPAKLQARVNAVTESLMKVFETDPAIAKLLTNTLRRSVRPVMEAGLTACELIYFVMRNTKWRDLILSRCSAATVQDFWSKFDELPTRSKDEKLASLENRIIEFAELPMIQATLGQATHTLDVEDMVETGKVVLINLAESEYISRRSANIIGTAIVNDIYQYALKRSRGDAQNKPFYLVMDEMQHFLTPNAASVLETCRQKGVHMILAHQHLNQLVSKNLDPPDSLLRAVMSCARTKVIFSAYPDDADILARFFSAEWPEKEIKNEIWRTTVLNYKLEKHILEGGADTDVTTTSEGSMQGEARIAGTSTSQGMVMDPDQGMLSGPMVTTLTESVVELENAAESWSSFSGSSTSSGSVSSWHEALMLIPILGKELASQEFWNHDEQRFRQAAKIIGLANQHAIIKPLNNKSIVVRIKTILPYPEDLEKILAAFDLSARHHPEIYQPYKKRLELWQSNMLLLSGGDISKLSRVSRQALPGKQEDEEISDFRD